MKANLALVFLGALVVVMKASEVVMAVIMLKASGVVVVVIMIRASWVVIVVIYSLESLQDSAAVPIPFGLSILTLGLCSNTMS